MAAVSKNEDAVYLLKPQQNLSICTVASFYMAYYLLKNIVIPKEFVTSAKINEAFNRVSPHGLAVIPDELNNIEIDVTNIADTILYTSEIPLPKHIIFDSFHHVLYIFENLLTNIIKQYPKHIFSISWFGASYVIVFSDNNYYYFDSHGNVNPYDETGAVALIIKTNNVQKILSIVLRDIIPKYQPKENYQYSLAVFKIQNAKHINYDHILSILTKKEEIPIEYYYNKTPILDIKNIKLSPSQSKTQAELSKESARSSARSSANQSAKQPIKQPISSKEPSLESQLEGLQKIIIYLKNELIDIKKPSSSFVDVDEIQIQDQIKDAQQQITILQQKIAEKERVRMLEASHARVISASANQSTNLAASTRHVAQRFAVPQQVAQPSTVPQQVTKPLYAAQQHAAKPQHASQQQSAKSLHATYSPQVAHLSASANQSTQLDAKPLTELEELKKLEELKSRLGLINVEMIKSNKEVSDALATMAANPKQDNKDIFENNSNLHTQQINTQREIAELESKLKASHAPKKELISVQALAQVPKQEMVSQAPKKLVKICSQCTFYNNISRENCKICDFELTDPPIMAGGLSYSTKQLYKKLKLLSFTNKN